MTAEEKQVELTVYNYLKVIYPPSEFLEAYTTWRAFVKCAYFKMYYKLWPSSYPHL